MSTANTISNLAPVYRKALKTWRPEIQYFANEPCPPASSPGRFFVRLPSRTGIAPISTCLTPESRRAIRWSPARRRCCSTKRQVAEEAQGHRHRGNTGGGLCPAYWQDQGAGGAAETTT